MGSLGEHASGCCRVLLGLFYAFSIIVTLVIYGVLQERIMDVAYWPGEDYFTFSVFLVFFNRIFGVVFALVMIIGLREPVMCHAALWKYCLISLSTVAASICQYEALKYVSFTVAILGKSFKMLPVMLWGRLFGTRYRMADWLVSLLVTIGVLWFMLSGSARPQHNHGSTWYGIMLLVGFTMLDAFTSSFQERIFKEDRTTKYNQMLYINLSSSVFSVVILLISGNIKKSFTFGNTHPEIYVDVSTLSAAAVVAQWFIYTQVMENGALAFAATMNVRQVISVVCSYLAYHHAITVMQIIGLGIVATSLALQIFWSCPSRKKSDPDEKEPLQPDHEKGESQSSRFVLSHNKARANCGCWKFLRAPL
jgi:adenosine 3'-phospho 5'-phosphosulfate transporter B2